MYPSLCWPKRLFKCKFNQAFVRHSKRNYAVGPAKEAAPANRQPAAPDDDSDEEYFRSIDPRLRQPAAPDSNAAAASGAKRPRQDDDSNAAKRRRRKKAGDDDSKAAAKERREKDFVVADDEFDVLVNRLQQQPAALSSTGEMQIDVPIPRISEYLATKTRPLRNLDLFNTGGGASNDVPPLWGHDVLQHLLSWREQPTEKPDGQPAARRQPAQYVCWKIMEVFKEAKKEFQDSIDEPETIGQASVERTRADTSNWQRELERTSLRLRRPPRVERASEIEAILKEHEGEARIWQTEREEWHALSQGAVLRTISSVKVGHRALQWRRRNPARIPP